jgi:hypothetical protein
MQSLADTIKTDTQTHSVQHADETPVQMLKPDDGKMYRAYRWACAPGTFEDMKAAVYDLCESRAGEHARKFWATGRAAEDAMTSVATRS